jgi:hypothetical protein
MENNKNTNNNNNNKNTNNNNNNSNNDNNKNTHDNNITIIQKETIEKFIKIISPEPVPTTVQPSLKITNLISNIRDFKCLVDFIV